MQIDICTWGTGGAFGRELGIVPDPERKRRDHSAVSIIGTENGQNVFHIMIDAGAPCVERMIDSKVTSSPDLLFITHTHNDHISDFDKLVNSRERGLQLLTDKHLPLFVISSPSCTEDPVFGLKAKFGYLRDFIKFLPVPCFNVWYSIRLPEGSIFPSNLSDGDKDYPVEFKLLPVYHASHAPGACMYIFRIKESMKRIVVTGDFESIEDGWVDNPDLKDPDAMLIETNTIKAVGANHTNWQQNMKLLSRWLSSESKTRVLVMHISGYEDCIQGYYNHVPSEQDWQKAISQFQAPAGVSIEIAEDGMCYPLLNPNSYSTVSGMEPECKHEKIRIEEPETDLPCPYEGVKVCVQCGKVLGPVKTMSCSECPDEGDLCFDRHRWYNE